MEVQLDIGTWSAARRSIRRPDGTEISLTRNESRLLEYLASRPESVHSIRDLLTQVWGWSTKAESRTAYTTIHRLRHKIERDPLSPRHLLAARGGYRFCPLAPAPIVHVDGHRLWGRDAELGWVEARIAEGTRRVLIVGPGGIGKTQLLRAIAARASGAIWVPAADAADRAALVAAIQRALDVPRAAGDEAEHVARALAGRGPLLVCLDNLEQVAEPARELLDRWLDAAPEARVVATSRSRLRAVEEQALALDPLPVPPEEADLGDGHEWPGLALFLERLGRARPSLRPDADVIAAAAEVTRRVQGVPVCLELAAARARHLSLQDIARHLPVRAAAVLADPDPDRPRHQAIRDVVAWSWALLSPAERDVAAQLSVFRGSFTLDDAEAVARVDGAWIGDLVGSLVDRSLLMLLSDGEAAARYGWLESIRAVVVDELGPEHPARARHLQRLGAQGDPDLCLLRTRIAGAEARRACREALPDLLAAVAFGSHGGAPEDAVRVCRALSQLVRGGLAVPAFVSATRAVRDRPDLDDDAALELATQEADARLLTGEGDLAATILRRALDEHTAARPGTRYRASRVLWTALRARGEAEEPARLLEELVVTLAPAAGDHAVIDARVQRGTAAAEAGRTDAAEADLRAALDLSRRLGTDGWTSAALGNLAFVHQWRGHLPEARALAEEALAIAEACDDAHRAQLERTRLATIEFMEGRFAAALTRLEQAERRLVRGGLAARATHVRANIGMCRWMLDDHEAGLALIRDACTAPGTNPHIRAQTTLLLGAFLGEMGLLREATAKVDAAVALAREHRSERVVAESHRVRALLQLRAGEADDAVEASRAGVEMAERLGERPRIALLRTVHAESLAVAGRLEEAVRARDAAVEAAEGLAWAEMLAAVYIGDARVSGLVGDVPRAERAAAAADALLASMEIGPRCYLRDWLAQAKATFDPAKVTVL